MTNPELDLTDDEAEELLADLVDEDDPDGTWEGEDDEEPAGDDPDDEEDDEEDDADPRVSKARQQAINYRQKLRDAEAERDALREEIAGHRTSEITRLAESAGMKSGADLLAVTDRASLLDDDGRPDPGKIKLAASEALADRPHWRGSPSLPARPTERLRGGPEPMEEQREVSWADLLQRPQ